MVSELGKATSEKEHAEVESDLDGYGVRMAQNVTGDGVDVKPLGTIWR